MAVRPRGCPRAANVRPSLSGASPVTVPGPAPSSLEHGDGQAACADARHGRPLFPLLNAADRGGSAASGTHCCEPSHLLRGGALVTNQHSFQRGGWLPRVPAVPVQSARSRVGGRGGRRRWPPVPPSNPIVSTTPLIGRRQRLSCRRRRRAAAVVDNHASSGMPCVANERQYRSGPSLASTALPVV